jgi:cellobiose phosphorylase
VLSTSSDTIGGIQFETDRSRFVGRGHTTADPVAIVEDRPLSNTVGAVLDPVFSLRCRVRLQPNETAQIVFTTGVARSREHAITLAEKYYDANIFERESRMAWTRAQVEMSHLHIDRGRGASVSKTRRTNSLYRSIAAAAIACAGAKPARAVFALGDRASAATCRS